MSSPNDDFKELRSLLACKRYEEPPPGYFNRFSDRVITKLETDELAEYSSWWQWIVDRFDAKPVVACIYGITVSSLLLAGFRLSQIFESEAGDTGLNMGESWLASAQGSILRPRKDWHGAFDEPAESTFSSSMSPILRESSSLLFSRPGAGATIQPVSFSFGH